MVSLTPLLTASVLTMSHSRRYANLRKYLEQEANAETARGKNLLCVVAARAKVSEGELQEIVDGGEISDEIANALALVTEPMDDQWEVDDTECDPEAVVDLTNSEIIARLQYAREAGKLNMIAEVSGVKGGLETLEGILARPHAQIDPVTRMMLIGVME